ncbi:MFS transporter [Terrilactibacillus sp. BCM23-1]|uniref:MFS transporter n=1 Tax=Terrilactibacillus tamarindi TaxID=2599694 RepID=A0A6N8CSK1_9BACI|nr:MFS transporter [Terrilactibacillus tamarindi]
MITHKKVKKHQSKITLKENLGYGLGDFASNLVYASISAFITYFYTDIVGGISAGIIGTIMFFSRLLDGFTDIGMGIITDKTKSKRGKARSWIFWLALPFALSTILVFTVPDIGLLGKIIYIVVTYNLFNLIYTGINVPYGVLNSLITRHQFSRSMLNIYRMACAVISTILVTGLTIPITNLFGGNQRGWIITYVFYSVISMLAFYITFKTTKERVRPPKRKKDIPLRQGFKALFRNKYWVILVMFLVVSFILIGLAGAINVYYANVILKDSSLVGVLGVALNIPQLLGLFLMPKLIAHVGKRNTMIIGIIISILGSIPMIIEPTSIAFIVIGLLVRGFGFASVVGSQFAMLADTIEYGEWKTGIRTEGLTYSAGSFGTKVGNGLAIAIVGWILSLTHYTGGSSHQPDTAVAGICFMFIYLPIILSFIQIILLLFYKIDKIYPRIINDLLKRHEKLKVKNPS